MGNSWTGKYGEGERFYGRPATQNRGVAEARITHRLPPEPRNTPRPANADRMALLRLLRDPQASRQITLIARRTGLDEAEVALLWPMTGSTEPGAEASRRAALVARLETDAATEARREGVKRDAAERLYIRTRLVELVACLDGAELAAVEAAPEAASSGSANRDGS